MTTPRTPLGGGDAFRRALSNHCLVAHALDAEQDTRLQFDPAAPSARASLRTPARRSSSCGATLNRDGCGAPRCRARRRSASAKSMRRATSSALQRAARSAPTAFSAPMNVPSGLGLRGQIWPLSRWVWHVDEARQHHAASEVDRIGRRCVGRARSMLAILPSATAMSASAKPSRSKAAPNRRRQGRMNAGRCVSRYEPVFGIDAAPSAPASARFRASAAE